MLRNRFTILAKKHFGVSLNYTGGKHVSRLSQTLIVIKQRSKKDFFDAYEGSQLHMQGRAVVGWCGRRMLDCMTHNQILVLRIVRNTGTEKLPAQTFGTCKTITPQKVHLKWELTREKKLNESRTTQWRNQPKNLGAQKKFWGSKYLILSV